MLPNEASKYALFLYLESPTLDSHQQLSGLHDKPDDTKAKIDINSHFSLCNSARLLLRLEKYCTFQNL